MCQRDGELVAQLIVPCTALAEDPSSVPSWLTISCNSFSRISDALFWPLTAPELVFTYHIDTYTHTEKENESFELCIKILLLSIYYSTDSWGFRKQFRYCSGAFMDRNGEFLEISLPFSLLHEDSRRYLWPATCAREFSQEPWPSAPSPVSVRDIALCKKQTFLVIESYTLWYPITATSSD